MKSLLERARDGEVLVSDGAMGTFLHAKGMGVGEFRSPGASLTPKS